MDWHFLSWIAQCNLSLPLFYTFSMLFLLLLLATFLEVYRQVRFLDFLLTVFLRITFLICWLAFSQSSPPHCRLQFCFVDFFSPLYLHLLILASRNASKGSLPLPKRMNFRKIMLRICSEIHDRSTLYNGKNLQHKFLDRKWPPPPPPSELFRKFIRFGRRMLP